MDVPRQKWDAESDNTIDDHAFYSRFDKLGIDMLDTRYIQDFMEPGNLIAKVNAMSAHPFSSWDNSCAAVILSDLLKEHIQSTINDDKMMFKLIETFAKVGVRDVKKMLIMTQSGTWGIFEPLADYDVNFAFGLMRKEGTSVSCTYKANYTSSPPASIEESMESHWVEFVDIKRNKNFDFSKERNSLDRMIKDAQNIWQKEAREDMMNDLGRLYNKINEEDKHHESIRNQVATAFACYFLFLQFVEVEQKEVQPKAKFIAKRYEGFKNQQNKKIVVADLSWSREMVAKLPIGVRGFFRQQPHGPGRLDRKLIYIEPFTRTYSRKSGKERVLKHT